MYFRSDFPAPSTWVFRSLQAWSICPPDAEAEQLIMFGLSPCATIRQGKLKPGVPVAFLKEIGHDGERARLARMLV